MFSDFEEAVTWVVATQTLSVTDDVLAELRKLEDKNGGPLQDNFRAVQEICDRKIYLVTN